MIHFHIYNYHTAHTHTHTHNLCKWSCTELWVTFFHRLIYRYAIFLYNHFLKKGLLGQKIYMLKVQQKDNSGSFLTEIIVRKEREDGATVRSKLSSV